MCTSSDRLPASRAYRMGHYPNTGAPIGGFGQHSMAFVVLIIAAVVLAVLPGLVTYLHVPHVIPTGETPATVGETSIAQAAWRAASAVLLLVCGHVFLMRGLPERNFSGTLILLLALVFPYIASPELPGRTDGLQVGLAAAVFLAVWNIGAPVDGLKWVPITSSFVAAYAIIGGFVNPEYMMYSIDSEKAIIGNWQLAGPFGHSNFLGIYCVLSLALAPLIVNVRWRIISGLILSAAIVLSASRTSLIAAGALLFWWIICGLRSVISLRVAGTVLIGLLGAIVVLLPLLQWDPAAFTGRAGVWAECLNAWRESPWVGLGFDWFTAGAQSLANFNVWAYVGTGHNLFVDTLVTTGVLGVCVIALVMLAAVRAVWAFDVTSYQIACYGYLIAFLAGSSTEATWTLLPTNSLFPVVGLVLAIVIVARPGLQAGDAERSAYGVNQRAQVLDSVGDVTRWRFRA